MKLPAGKKRSFTKLRTKHAHFEETKTHFEDIYFKANVRKLFTSVISVGSSCFARAVSINLNLHKLIILGPSGPENVAQR